MDKETLSNYGWVVILVLILAVLLALASPFGNFVAGAIKATTAGLFGVNQSALNAGGITIPGQEFDTVLNGSGEDSGSSEETEIQEAGLYETGSNYTVQLKTWDELLSDGTITVVNGAVECKNTSIAGDLLMPNDGSITTLEYPAFSGCERLTGVIIPDSVTSIGGGSFGTCMSLTSIGTKGSGASVEIPSSVTSIAGSAFYNCRSLLSVTIPNSVTSIGSYAFGGCSGITSVDLGSGVKTIGQQSFFGCNALTSIVIPDSVTDIESDAFTRCSSLTSVTLGANVVNIGKQAFYMCSVLSGEITIPASVKSIGAYAFRETALTKFIYKGTTSQWDGISTTSPWIDDDISYIECTDGKAWL